MMWDSDEAHGLDLGPVGHLNEHLVQVAVEVAFEKAVLLISREESVPTEARRHIADVLLGSDKDGHLKLGINARGICLDTLDLIFPLGEASVGDEVVEGGSELGVGVDGILSVGMLRDEIESLNGSPSLVNSDNQTACPDGQPTKLWVGEGHRWWTLASLVVAVKGLLNFLDFILE